MTDSETGKLSDNAFAADNADRNCDAAPEDTQAPEAAAGMYHLPSLDLLSESPDNGWKRDFADKSEILSQALQRFGVKAAVTNVVHGPAVTRYELEPAPGVKVNKFTNLSSADPRQVGRRH